MLDEVNQPNDTNDVFEPENTVQSDSPETSDSEFEQQLSTELDESLNDSANAEVISEADLTDPEEVSQSIGELLYADTQSDHPPERVLEDDDAVGNIEVISEADLESEDEAELTVTTFDLDADDAGDDDSIDSSELNIAIEAATEPVTVLSEDDLELLNEVTSEKEIGEDEDEVVIKDYLNEDDGDDFMPDYLKPPAPSEPEWKLLARQLREEREAKQRNMIEKRREEDNRVIEERKSRMQERKEEKHRQEEKFSQAWEKRQSDKQQAYDEMIQRIREEREQKLQERAEERESGRKLTYPKPETRKSYPKPSEIKRMEREQPKNVLDKPDSKQPSPPLNKSAGDDLESRVSRLSKPDEPSDTKPDANDDSDGEE